MKKLFLILLLFGCNPHFSTPYNQSMVDLVQSTWDANSILYDNTEYDSTAYGNVSSGIDRIIVLDSSRPKSKKLLYIDNIIRDRFFEYQLNHITEQTLTIDQLDVYRRSMNTLWKDRHTAEVNLKK